MERLDNSKAFISSNLTACNIRRISKSIIDNDRKQEKSLSTSDSIPQLQSIDSKTPLDKKIWILTQVDIKVSYPSLPKDEEEWVHSLKHPWNKWKKTIENNSKNTIQ